MAGRTPEQPYGWGFFGVPRKDDAIQELQSDPRIYGRCPHCEEDFPLREARLFYADRARPKDIYGMRHKRSHIPHKCDGLLAPERQPVTRMSARVASRLRPRRFMATLTSTRWEKEKGWLLRIGSMNAPKRITDTPTTR